jgi:hypothetical protein
MKRRALTLIELIISITLAGILIAVIIPQFVMLTSLKMAVEDRVYVMREALITMNRMSGILRFAKPSSIWLVGDLGTPIGWTILQARIEGGHTARIPTEIGGSMMFMPNPDNPALGVIIWIAGGNPEWIGQNITSWDRDNTGNRLWNPATKLLTLRITVTKNNASAHIERVVKILGDDN